jgi:hypothetical protein
MIYRHFYLNRKHKIIAYALLTIFAVTAVMMPALAFNLLGYTIAASALFLLGFFGYSLFSQYRSFSMIPSIAFYQMLLLTLLAIVFIIIPATSLQEIVGFLLFIALLLIALYHLYFRQKWTYYLPSTRHYIYGIVSLVGAIIVILYRDQSSERFMQVIGLIVLYYSVQQLWKLKR